MNTTWILASNAMITILLSGSISYFIKLKNYKFIYYEDFLKRKVDVYKIIESINLKISEKPSYIDDGHYYHLLLVSSDKLREVLIEVKNILIYRFWISNRTLQLLEKLNSQLEVADMFSNNNQDMSKYAKDEYDNFEKLRIELSNSTMIDFVHLSKIRRHLKQKRKIAKPV